MPYVEVWVDNETLSDDQCQAIRNLVDIALAVAAEHWPNQNSYYLERAALKVVRAILLDGDSPNPWPVDDPWPVDEKYKKWLKERNETRQDIEQ